MRELFILYNGIVFNYKIFPMKIICNDLKFGIVNILLCDNIVLFH